MIPKIIHYCWFGGAPKPALIQHCIASWRKRLPEYEIKEWNESNFDVNMSNISREAYYHQLWAFVADYCRLYALSTEGGIYMDTDVIVLRPFEQFLNHSFFSCHEYQPWEFEPQKANYIDTTGKRLNGITQQVPGFGIQGGVMMAEKGSPFIRECLDYYNKLHLEGDIIVCRLLSCLLEKYGYRYNKEAQNLSGNIRIDAPKTFANMTTLDESSYAWHLYYRSWGRNGFSLKQQFRNKFTRLYLLAQLLYHRKYSISLIAKIIGII